MTRFSYKFNRPFVRCLLINGSNFVYEDLLLDSGADISVVSRKIGSALGFKLRSGEKVEEFSGYGGSSPAVRRKLIIKLANEVLKVEFAWSLEERGVPNVLGRKDIFDYFDIEFKQHRKLVIFREAE